MPSINLWCVWFFLNRLGFWNIWQNIRNEITRLFCLATLNQLHSYNNRLLLWKRNRFRVVKIKTEQLHLWHTSSISAKVCSLLVYLPSCLSQETAKWSLRSSSQAATCYCQSNHSKAETIPLSALLKDTTSELSGRPIFKRSLLMLNVKQESCEYQLLKSFGLIQLNQVLRSTDFEVDVLTSRPKTTRRQAHQKFFFSKGSFCSETSWSRILL